MTDVTYVQPILSVLIIILAFGAWRSWRFRKRGRPILLSLAVVALFLVSWLPFARFVLHPFEARFPPRALPPGDAQIIVVVSGSMIGPSRLTGERRVGSDTYVRCLYAVWLYQHWHPLPILLSGGPPRSEPHEVPDAIVMRQVLEQAGVPASAIWVEDHSHSTHENALYSAKILNAKHIQKIVLITSGFHMLRAYLSFLKQGLQVTPAGCDYHTYGSYDVPDYFPEWMAIQLDESVLHETVGLAWYWLHGWV
jgi:uncharacterized SAM-binding protein YcdF (DUF218 family)